MVVHLFFYNSVSYGKPSRKKKILITTMLQFSNKIQLKHICFPLFYVIKLFITMKK